MVKKNCEAVHAKQIEPLKPDIVRDNNQQEREDVTGADNKATPLMCGTHYVLMASVGTNYKAMHPLNVVLYTGSIYRVISRDVFTVDWKRFLISDARLPNSG